MRIPKHIRKNWLPIDECKFPKLSEITELPRTVPEEEILEVQRKLREAEERHLLDPSTKVKSATMKTTKQWLDEKLDEYRSDPKYTVEDVLTATTNAIEQYVKGPSAATKGLLISCLEHNRLFLEAIHQNSEGQ